MKTVFIVLGIIAGLGVLLIVVLPFMIGYAPKESGKTIEGKGDTGIFKSADRGVTWEKKIESRERVALNAYVILDFVFHPQSSEKIFVGTKGGGLWKTEDGAESWIKISDTNGVLDPSSQVYRVAFSKTDPNEMYLAVFQNNRGRVLKSTNGGESFREVYFTPLEKFGVLGLFVDERGSVFMVTGQGGFFESRDRGESWKIIRWFRDGLTRLVVDPKNFSVMYVMSSPGNIFKTSDRGGHWVDITGSLSRFDGSKSNQTLYIDPNTSRLYLASKYGVLKSDSGGLSWDDISIIIPPEVLPALTVFTHPANPKSIYVSLSNELYKSDDGGVSWSVASSPGGKRVTYLAIDVKNPSGMYAVVSK